MLKRKLISLGQRHSNYNNETDSDINDSGGTSTKRFKPDLSSDNTDDQERYNSDVDQADLSFSIDEEQYSNATEPLHSTLNLPSKKDSSSSNGVDTEIDLMNSSQYDGYQSFMNSFHLFSDEESCESDSQVSQKYIKTKNKGNASRKKKTEWLNRSEDVYFTEDKVRLQTITDKVRIIGFYLKDLEFVFMDHPSSVPIVGYLKITLIAGKASIQGYSLEINKPVTVFSQKQTGILSVTSHYCDEEQICSMQNNVRTKLSHFLKDVPADNVKNYMKRSMKYSSAVFIIQNCILPPALQFLEVYSHFALSFEKKNNGVNLEFPTSRYTAFSANEENILKFGHEYDEIFTTIHKHLFKINRRPPGESQSAMDIGLTSSEEELGNGPDFRKITGFRILISGPKKCGKSTMLRYLVNRFLNKYPEVYYLDTDPGQSEFTPPGAVSLLKLTEPVFGPPYSHLRKPLKMIFTGTITPESGPPMHMKSIDKMINYFNLHFPDSVLLVNTVGWLTGIGGLIYEHVRKSLLPAVEIQLNPGLTSLNISVEGKLLKCSVGFERDAATSTKQGDNRPQDLRDWTVLAYLGQCQEYYLQPQTLNALRPVGICWDQVAVYNFNTRVLYNRYYEALNTSVVALCSVKNSDILQPSYDDLEHPLTLKDEPDNECLGYGFVRAVDETLHLLYIVTPLDCDVLNQKVNAILSGNILIPRSVIYEQNILDVELDYTDGSKEGRTELRKKIRKRSRFNSSNTRL